MHIFDKIKRWFRVVHLILTTKYKDAYLVSFKADIIGEDMLPYYRKALTKHGFHLHNYGTGYDGSFFEAWLKNGYTIGHRMSDEESSSLYANDNIYETMFRDEMQKKLDKER